MKQISDYELIAKITPTDNSGILEVEVKKGSQILAIYDQDDLDDIEFLFEIFEDDGIPENVGKEIVELLKRIEE